MRSVCNLEVLFFKEICCTENTYSVYKDTLHNTYSVYKDTLHNTYSVYKDTLHNCSCNLLE
jgi:uncharacterized protein (DUF927 family)